MAQRFANLARELAAANDRLSEKEEQIEELKSERSNTRVSLGYCYSSEQSSKSNQPEHPLNFTIHRTSCLYLTVVKFVWSTKGIFTEKILCMSLIHYLVDCTGCT